MSGTDPVMVNNPYLAALRAQRPAVRSWADILGTVLRSTRCRP